MNTATLFSHSNDSVQAAISLTLMNRITMMIMMLPQGSNDNREEDDGNPLHEVRFMVRNTGSTDYGEGYIEPADVLAQLDSDCDSAQAACIHTLCFAFSPVGCAAVIELLDGLAAQSERYPSLRLVDLQGTELLYRGDAVDRFPAALQRFTDLPSQPTVSIFNTSLAASAADVSTLRAKLGKSNNQRVVTRII